MSESVPNSFPTVLLLYSSIVCLVAKLIKTYLSINGFVTVFTSTINCRYIFIVEYYRIHDMGRLGQNNNLEKEKNINYSNIV